MKISQLFQAMIVSSFVAVPGMAAALPSVTPDAPVSLCGEEKASKGTSAQDEKSEKKDAKKSDKKQTKDEKSAGKGSA